MTDRIELFHKFARHHEIDFSLPVNDVISYCGDLDCVKCVVSTECWRTSGLVVLNNSEIEILKTTHPEYFI